MFNNLKKIKELQSSLKEEKIKVENKGISVIVNGNLEIEEINLNPSLEIESQEKILKNSINEAFRKIQLLAIKKIGPRF